MPGKTKKVSAGGTIMLVLIFLNAVVLKGAFIKNSKWYLVLFVTVPLLLIALYVVRQEKQKKITKSKKIA